MEVRGRLSSEPLVGIILAVTLACFLHASTAAYPATVAYGTTGIAIPCGVAIDPNSDAIYIVDYGNHRVLRFDNRNTLNPSSIPTMAFGQSSLAGVSANGGGSVSASGFHYPYAACVDGSGTLYVSDNFNHRVLLFHNAASITTMPYSADGVLGQSSFGASSANQGVSASANGMMYPNGCSVMGTSLWLADNGNNRVLRYDNVGTLPITNAAATAVLGQPDFITATYGVASNKLYYPSDVFPTIDGVYVADGQNNRVLFFPPNNSIVIGPGSSAIAAYGQSNFTSSSSGTTAQKMSSPKSVQLGPGGVLFVSDIFNSRIIMYPPTPPSSPFGISAVDVFGQSTFTSSSYGPAPDQLDYPYLIAYDDKYGCLWVTDQDNNRIVKYCNITMPSVQNNISSNGVSMQFSGRSPSVTMTPTSSSPAPGANNNTFFLHPASIEEVASNGTIFQSISFPQAGYTISSSIDSQQNQHFQFLTTLTAGQNVDINYILFAAPANLSSAGISFNTFPGTLKLSLTLSNWIFSSPSNTLHIHFTIIIQPAPPSNSLNRTVSGNITTFTLATSTVTAVAKMLHLGIADNSTIVPIQFFLNSSTPLGSGNNGTLDLELVIPSFASSFHYDPDFSITLGGSGSGSSSSSGDGLGDGGSGSLLPLLALIALIIPVCFVLITVVVVVVFFVMRKWRWRNVSERELDAVNWNK